jgi:hypothetical protein
LNSVLYFSAKRATAGAILCGLGVAAGIAYLTRDKWVEVPLALLLTVCVAIPAAVLRLASFAWGRRRAHTWLRQVDNLCLALILFTASLWAGVPLRLGVEWYDHYKAQDFCAFLVPSIERHRIEHGRYPDDVVWLMQQQGDLPKLIEKGFQYHSRNDSFLLAIVAPSQPFAWHVFDSKRGTWELEVD